MDIRWNDSIAESVEKMVWLLDCDSGFVFNGPVFRVVDAPLFLVILVLRVDNCSRLVVLEFWSRLKLEFCRLMIKVAWQLGSSAGRGVERAAYLQAEVSQPQWTNDYRE